MVLAKTRRGQAVFRDRSVPLSPRQRTAFILFDGRRSMDEVSVSCGGIATSDVWQMVELGLLEFVHERTAVAALRFKAPVAEPGANARARQRYEAAYPIAARLTASLGLRGLRLNLQVEGCRSYEDLLALAPKVRAAVGPERSAELDRALRG